MADIEEDGQMDDIGSGAAGGSVSGKRFEVKKWNAALSARRTRHLPQVRSALLHGDSATMHSIFIASLAGSKPAKFVLLITGTGNSRSMEDENWAEEVEGAVRFLVECRQHVTRPHQPSAYVSNWADEVDTVRFLVKM